MSMFDYTLTDVTNLNNNLAQEHITKQRPSSEPGLGCYVSLSLIPLLGRRTDMSSVD